MKLLTELINQQTAGSSIITSDGSWTYIGKIDVELSVDGAAAATYSTNDPVGSTDNPDVVWTDGSTNLFQYTVGTTCVATATLNAYLSPYYDLYVDVTADVETLEISHTITYDNSVPSDPRLIIAALYTNPLHGGIPGDTTRRSWSWNKSSGGASGIFLGTEAIPYSVDYFGDDWVFNWNGMPIIVTGMDVVFTDSGSPAAGLRNSYGLGNMTVAVTWYQPDIAINWYHVNLDATNPPSLNPNLKYAWYRNGVPFTNNSSALDTYLPGDYKVEVIDPAVPTCIITKTFILQ